MKLISLLLILILFKCYNSEVHSCFRTNGCDKAVQTCMEEHLLFANNTEFPWIGCLAFQMSCENFCRECQNKKREFGRNPSCLTNQYKFLFGIKPPEISSDK